MAARLAGIAAKAGAVLVDVKTAWIIEGIGHGHDDASTLAAADGGAAVLERSGGEVTHRCSSIPLSPEYRHQRVQHLVPIETAATS